MASCRSRGWRARCRRKLTNKGLRQANSMANWLKEKLPENSRVIVSPTKRTQQTAMARWFSGKKTQSTKKIVLRTVISPDML